MATDPDDTARRLLRGGSFFNGLIATGTVNAFGRFPLRFTMPTMPSLVGVAATARRHGHLARSA
ncbi:MAG: hypothetical protein AAF628_37805 [Planctomycetota bacterium]